MSSESSTKPSARREGARREEQWLAARLRKQAKREQQQQRVELPNDRDAERRTGGSGGDQWRP
jgi:hypothetical protein